MDSYILRIYKRNRRDVEKIAGVIENVDIGEKVFFRSLAELIQALRPVRRKSSKANVPDPGIPDYLDE
jgi:hypothetical protein